MLQSETEFERRLTAVEAAVAALSANGSATQPGDSAVRPDHLWVLRGLADRGVEGVLMAGSLTVPDAGPVEWQYALTADALFGQDWTELAATIDALSHPARLTIVRLVLTGVRTTAALVDEESLGTAGQLHHHLRQLVAAGWLTMVKRGEYIVPAHRVVPLLVTILAANR